MSANVSARRAAAADADAAAAAREACGCALLRVVNERDVLICDREGDGEQEFLVRVAHCTPAATNSHTIAELEYAFKSAIIIRHRIGVDGGGLVQTLVLRRCR